MQEDLQQLRDALLQKNLGAGNKALDISSLESAIEKTEDGIKVFNFDYVPISLQ